MGYVLLHFFFISHFQLLAMFNTIVGAIAEEAGSGAASRYGSGSDQMMQLLEGPAPAPQHCIFWISKKNSENNTHFRKNRSFSRKFYDIFAKISRYFCENEIFSRNGIS
jgi:hypothetical protein